MALAPETPRRSRRRQTAHSPRTRSNTGKVLATLLAVGTASGVGVGLLKPTAEAPKLVCGGTERWNIKSANDPDAAQINPNPAGPYKVADLNKILPGPIDSGGRMAVEKKEYTVRGYLSYFKDETDDDFHVVITDKPGDFAPTKADPPNGRSMVVEFPDAGCFAGKTGLGSHTSALGQTLAEARLAFEEQTKNLNGKSIHKPVPVTVTGVGFFDFDHFQTGRAIPHPGVDGQNKVFELHPVTAITFDAESEPD